MVPSPTRLAIAFYLLGTLHKQKRKKPWLERQRLRHANIMSLIECEDLSLIIDTETFDELLRLVRPYLTKRDHIMNESVTAEERLIATLLYLASGKSFQELKDRTLLCPQLLAKIIPETCSAIFTALGQYIKLPKTEEEWKAIAQSFEKHWQFKNCIGCLDARHILIKKPTDPDSSGFLNHDGTYSIICVAVVNANHEFIYVESGFRGGFSSELLPQCSDIGQKIIEDDLYLPKSCPLLGTDVSVPYVFIGDEFWPVDTNIMCPYIGEQLSDQEKIFNYRLYRANRAENTFGLLKTNFSILNRTIELELGAVNKLVLATCALHNFLMKKPCYNSGDNEMFDWEDTKNERYLPGDWRFFTDPLMPVSRVDREPWNDGAKVRDHLKNYFSTTGRLPFQEKMMNMRASY